MPWQFALGNLDIIPTSCMAVLMAARRFDGFSAFLTIFRAPLGCPGVERQFFGALDGEEFFAIEGSHAN